jgi:low temperature requirement protein LtrA
MRPAIWQPPTLRQDSAEDSDRRATWLELFYDLVFVVTISQLSHYLSEHLSWLGVVSFMLFFVPIWWCWVGLPSTPLGLTLTAFSIACLPLWKW